MVNSLEEILFMYFYKNNLLLPDIDFIKYKYDIWKEENVKHCSYCNKLIKKEFNCECCGKYYYCKRCFDNNTYNCFMCNKSVCFVCITKRRVQCIKCKYGFN
jgi:hypothetical protein